MLLDLFRAGRLDSVSLLSDSIDRNHDIPLLWPAERLLLYFWIERYHAIDSLARHFDEVCKNNHPAEQVIWNVLSFHSLENIDLLVSWIDQSECDDNEFGFRVRLLETMILGDWDDQASVNREIISLVNLHFHEEVESPQETIQTKPQRHESETPDDPWALELSIGLGPTSVSGKFADYLSTRAGLSFNFSVYYKRWCFSLLMQPIFAKLKRDIPVGNGPDVWEAGKSAIIGNYGLALGYSIVDNAFLKINPFIGLSFSDCTPTEEQILDNEALRDAGIRWGVSTMYGIDTGFKLYNMINVLKRNNIPVSFNVRMNLIPKMFNKVHYSGNMWLLTFGVSMALHSW